MSSPAQAPLMPSPRGGGAERVAVTLADAFAERGHRVDLVLAELPPVVEAIALSRSETTSGEAGR